MEPVRKKFELPELMKLKSQAYPEQKKASKKKIMNIKSKNTKIIGNTVRQ
jgi:hypothetical protein